jgi:hypothetical protein
MSVKIEVFGKQVKINGRHAADAICEATARSRGRLKIIFVIVLDFRDLATIYQLVKGGWAV